MIDFRPYSALVLAGGRGSRMGGQDKGWVRWQGQPLVAHTLSRLRAQTLKPAEILISANRNLTDYAATGCRVVVDDRPGFPGPLAGIEAALQVACHDRLLVVPCDMPLIPVDLFDRLQRAQRGQAGTEATFACVGADASPLCALISINLLPRLSGYLERQCSKVQDWFTEVAATPVRFDDSDAFRNINSLEE